MTATFARAQQTICVFDVQGRSGDIFKGMEEWALASKNTGANIKLLPYPKEEDADAAFKAGKCDGVYLTSLRARYYNKFAGSIDALGAVPNITIAERAIRYALDKRNAKRMLSKVNGEDFEVAGIDQIGTAYLFVKYNKIKNPQDPIKDLEGKKFSFLGYDVAQRYMLKKIKAVPVSSEISNLVAKFNNNQVDMTAAPAYLYKPFEMHKGLGAQGAVVVFPVVNVTMLMVIRPEKFPTSFGATSRGIFLKHLPKTLQYVNRTERDIPEKYKLMLTKEQTTKYQMIVREARVELTKQGVYDQQMMSVLKRARCTIDRTNFECSLMDE
ncbi:putative solute-binding protein [Acinetobacter sp. CFCC 10889]|uniref:putative solute-binding protein n=1 Tax=Acinetobacter sp. CFCC 10889 TaxID=1775557 RepID=UPI000DD09789|nr:putative solute-binding protein [Acinetobacter sp. CFCC 10889]